jgi:hypothetical protein
MRPEIAKLVQQIHDTPGMAVFAIAGAGNQAITWVLGVGGASRTVLEIVVPYAQTSFAEFVGYEPEQTVSAETADDLARAAYRRAVHLRISDAPVFGIACTATIATDRTKRGEHRCHVSVWSGTDLTTYSLTLEKGLREREGEDEVVSLLVMRALAESLGIGFDLPMGLSRAEKVIGRSILYDDPIAALADGHIECVIIDESGTQTADGTHEGVVLPGSFNPLHEGHVALAQAASEMTGLPAIFELSVANVDKPPLDEDEIRRRAAQFEGRHMLALTREPRFFMKARLFPGCVFAIGWDTAVRIVDPMYYEGKHSNMIVALEVMRREGCRFLVAGRVDESGVFRTVDDIDIPADYTGMFEAIPESRFRIDISSTELRASGRTL